MSTRIHGTGPPARLTKLNHRPVSQGLTTETVVRDSLLPGCHRLTFYGLFLPDFGTVVKILTYDRMTQQVGRVEGLHPVVPAGAAPTGTNNRDAMSFHRQSSTQVYDSGQSTLRGVW